MAKNNINTISSTSCGRLFDGACAILGIRLSSTFEGEAANALMFKAMEYKSEIDGDNFPLEEEEGSLILPTNVLLRRLIKGKLEGEDISFLAYYFHKTLSNMIVRACVQIKIKTGIKTVALTGGVFQNTLLLSMCDIALKKEGFTILKHSLIPPNDGGIALGQAVYAMNKVTKENEQCV